MRLDFGQPMDEEPTLSLPVDLTINAFDYCMIGPGITQLVTYSNENCMIVSRFTRSIETRIIAAYKPTDDKKFDGCLKSPFTLETTVQVRERGTHPGSIAATSDLRTDPYQPLYVTRKGVQFSFGGGHDGHYNVTAKKGEAVVWRNSLDGVCVKSVSIDPATALPGPEVEVVVWPVGMKNIEIRNPFQAGTGDNLPKLVRKRDTFNAKDGSVASSIGYGRGSFSDWHAEPQFIVPHDAGKEVFSVDLGERTCTARSKGNGLGPWVVTCTNRSGKTIWELELMKGLWVTGMEAAESPLRINILGNRLLTLDPETGDIIRHARFIPEER